MGAVAGHVPTCSHLKWHVHLHRGHGELDSGERNQLRVAVSFSSISETESSDVPQRVFEGEILSLELRESNERGKGVSLAVTLVWGRGGARLYMYVLVRVARDVRRTLRQIGPPADNFACSVENRPSQP